MSFSKNVFGIHLQQTSTKISQNSTKYFMRMKILYTMLPCYTPSLEKSAIKPKSSKFSRRNDKYNPKFLKLYIAIKKGRTQYIVLSKWQTLPIDFVFKAKDS